MKKDYNREIEQLEREIPQGPHPLETLPEGSRRRRDRLQSDICAVQSAPASTPRATNRCRRCSRSARCRARRTPRFSPALAWRTDPEARLLRGRGWPEVIPENHNDSNVAFNKSNQGELMDFRNQDQRNFNNQYYEGLVALKNSCRQRLVALNVQYELQKNKLEHERKMKALGQTGEAVKLFAMNEGRIPVDNRSSKPNSSGTVMKRNAYSGSTDSEGSIKKDHLQPKKPSGTHSAIAAWTSQITVPQPFNMTMRENRRKTVLRSRLTKGLEMHLIDKQQREEAECQKKFRALPVPGHVYLQLYDEINERNEKKRQKEIEKRQEYLLFTQKPFSFTKKEERRKDQLKEQLHSMVPEPEKTAKPIKKIPPSVKDPSVSEKLKEDEFYRKIRRQIRAEDMLKKAAAPVEYRPNKKLVTTSSMRTRQEKLGFLEEKPKFKPRINPGIPDFTKLYNAFQRKARRETKETTKCVPFELQTSKLPSHQNRAKCKVVSKDSHKKAKTHLIKSNSFSDIRSLSSHTLPISTTNAARKRQTAVRKSLEERDKQETEKVKWMERYKMNVQEMSKTLSIRAKAMDPHQSLAETYKEIVKKYRQADLKRKKEYNKELEEMKRRVCCRPYLFEQVTQKNAAAEAEKRYREKLRQAGLDEEFVLAKGRNADDIPLAISDIEDSGQRSECRENHNCIRSSDSLENFISLDEENVKNRYEEENGKLDEDEDQETDSSTDQETHLDCHSKENSTGEQDESFCT
ncbi:protein FAM161B [Narcine bancroftii]|uniref:protein FAM161B n=1 Tax=Narcine bancroftii TaxID=1343680 RepID=UPI00383154B0